jgi:hypothetical protein
MVFDVAGASHSPGDANHSVAVARRTQPTLPVEATAAAEQSEVGFSLQAEHSYKVLDVLGDGVEEGTALVQWDYHGGPNQRFHL